MNRCLRALAVALAAAAICVAGQNSAPKGPNVKGPVRRARIQGVVRDQAKNPIPGVSISIEWVNGYVSLVTNGKGAYSKDLPQITGTYRVTPVNVAGRIYQFTPASADVSGKGGIANFDGFPKK